MLLQRHLTQLKLPTFQSEYAKLARQCAAEANDHVQYLLRLRELELIERERRMLERRIKAAKFPATKSLDSFDFKAVPSLNKVLVLELARCEFVGRRENVVALGPSGTGKTHVALGLGLAACQKCLKVRFTAAAALVHELIEAADERRLQRLQKLLASQDPLIIDELGFVPLSKSGAELLFEVISRRYERGSIVITSNLPFDEWTEVFRSERLTGVRRAVLPLEGPSIPPYPRPADPPRPHPRDERQELQAAPEPQGQGLTTLPSMQLPTGLWPVRLAVRRLSGSTPAKAPARHGSLGNIPPVR
jgi:DNA replication protein DnaC